MDSLRISVVIPVFNGERYLRKAITSALEQSYPPHQVIVADDGSTDSSRAIAESFGGAVTCMTQANQGPSAARNLGILSSSGDWIAFLDADDYWSPDKLSLQVAAIRANPNVDFVYSGWTSLDDDGVSESFRAESPEWVKKRLAFECPLIPSTVLARRSLLLRHPWSTMFRSSEDWWLFYRLSRDLVFAAVETPTTFYRLHDESLTQRDWRSVLMHAQLVAAEIQQDFAGFERFRLKRMVDSRLLASAALAARRQQSPESLRFITRSLLAWPFPNVRPTRYQVFLKMLVQRLSSMIGSL